jgi:hypothetical protein
MKKNLIKIIIFVILWVVSLSIIQHYFPKVETETIYQTDTVWRDSLIVEKIPNPYPVYIDTSRIDTVYIPADTTELINKYLTLHQKFHSVYNYIDTLKNDTTAFIKVKSKITKNKPIKYDLVYYDRTPSVINNQTIINNYSTNELYVGIDVGNKEFSANILYKSKKDIIFGVGYDPINNSLQGKAYIKLNTPKLW